MSVQHNITEEDVTKLYFLTEYAASTAPVQYAEAALPVPRSSIIGTGSTVTFWMFRV